MRRTVAAAVAVAVLPGGCAAHAVTSRSKERV
jgi:hypothetical protein